MIQAGHIWFLHLAVCFWVLGLPLFGIFKTCEGPKLFSKHEISVFIDIWCSLNFGTQKFRTNFFGHAAKARLTSPDFVEFWSAEIPRFGTAFATFASGKPGGDKKTGRVMSCVRFG